MNKDNDREPWAGFRNNDNVQLPGSRIMGKDFRQEQCTMPTQRNHTVTWNIGRDHARKENAKGGRAWNMTGGHTHEQWRAEPGLCTTTQQKLPLQRQRKNFIVIVIVWSLPDVCPGAALCLSGVNHVTACSLPGTGCTSAARGGRQGEGQGS